MIRNVFCLASVVLALAAAAAADDDAGRPAVEHFSSAATAGLGLPFSEAVRVGDLIFLSGMIGNRPGKMELVPGGIEAETEQTLENVRRTLEGMGSSLDDVVKCTVMLADIRDWPRMNAVYARVFRKPYPARSALGASGLALGARVEIECIAGVRAAEGGTEPSAGSPKER